MCGISGYVNVYDKGLIRKMNKVLRHRGPNDSGIFSDSRVTLGHTRLSIIDLSKAGRQPMTDEDGEVVIVFNGEIYNFMELKERYLKEIKFASNTDTEVIIYLYKKFGTNFVNLLDGMFALAIYDTKKHKLILARDIYGKKPLYYHLGKGGVFVFSSEIKSMLKFDGLGRELNLDVIADQLLFRYNMRDETIVRGIKSLEPSSLMEVGIGEEVSLSKRKYHRIEIGNRKPEKGMSRVLLELLREAVRKRMIADVPLGTTLSGGLDSSVVSFFCKRFKEDIQSFTIGYKEGESEDKSALHASLVIGTKHREMKIGYADMLKEWEKIMWHLEEPITNSTVPLTYFLAKHIRNNDTTVALIGEGSDELFMGYTSYKLAKLLEHVPLRSETKFKLFYGIGYKALLPKHVQRYTKLGSREPYKNLGPYSLKKVNELEIKYELPNFQLMRIDKLMMAHSIEARAPYLDKFFSRRVLRIKPSLRVNFLSEKLLLRKSACEILPREIAFRKKGGPRGVIKALLNAGLMSKLSRDLDLLPFVNKKQIERLMSKNKPSGNETAFLFHLAMLTSLIRLFDLNVP